MGTGRSQVHFWAYVCPRNFLTILQVFKTTAFCIRVYVSGWMLRIFKLSCNVFGMIPVDDTMIGTVLTVVTRHCVLSSIDRSVYFAILVVCVAARLCVFGIAMSMRYTIFLALSKMVMSGLLKWIVLSVIIVLSQ